LESPGAKAPRRVKPVPRQTGLGNLDVVMIADQARDKKIWTEAELQALPDDGFVHEIVDGELMMSPKITGSTAGSALDC
jgi:hypothetical protein